MFVIILFICLSVSVNCDDNDEGKYIDLLPEAEKREFLERVAKRILEEVATTRVAKLPSVTLHDAKLDETSSYVSKLLNEEAADLKRRNMNLVQNKTKDVPNSSLRGGDKEMVKYIDLTLRDGPPELKLDLGNIPEQKESTTNAIITEPGIGKESSTDTTEQAVTAVPEKVIVDDIKTNDLQLHGIENITEIKNVATSAQRGTTSSPIEDITKRNFRRNDDKINIQITIEDANSTKSSKIEASELPPHVVYVDNLKKSKSFDASKTNESKSSITVSSTPNTATLNENFIQDDAKSQKIRANEETVHVVHKDNLNKSIPVNPNKSNDSINNNILILIPNSVNQTENSIVGSINQTPNLTQNNENKTISTQQKPLRNDRDIRELAREDDEFQDNSRRREVNVIPEEDQNDKEVNVLPEYDVEVVNQKNTNSNITSDISAVTNTNTLGVNVASTINYEVINARADIEGDIRSTETTAVIVTSTDASKAIVSGIDGLVTIASVLDDTTPANVIVENSALIENNFTGTGLFNFRTSDINWPQAENYSSVRVFDTAIVNNTKVITTTNENTIESTTDVKHVTLMSTKQGKQNAEAQRDFRKNAEALDTATLVLNIKSTEANIPQAVELDTVSIVKSNLPRQVIRTTRELNMSTKGKIDDLTSNMENTKVELIKKKKNAHKPKIESVSTSQTEVILESISENGTQTKSTKTMISENEYPLARAQEDDIKTKTLEDITTTKIGTVSRNEASAPLQGFTIDANSELLPNISDHNQETTTEVRFISVMSTKTKFSSTNPSIDSIHVERRIGEYDSIDSEESTTLSKTKEMESTTRKTAITTEFLSEVPSERVIELVSEPAKETPNKTADKSVSERFDESASKPVYESVNKTVNALASEVVSEPTTKSAVEIHSEVNDSTVSESLNDRASGSASELVTESGTEVYSKLDSDENKEVVTKPPRALAVEPKNEMTSKLINDSIRKPSTELAKEIFSEASSQSNNFVSEINKELSNELGNETTSKSANVPVTEPISESIRGTKSASEPGNEATSISAKESANEPISESIPFKPISQPIFGTKSDIEQSTINKNKNELKEGTTLLPYTLPTPSTSDQTAQIQKPVIESNYNLKYINVTADSTVKDTTAAGIQVTTAVVLLSTPNNGDIEVKTQKFTVESTSRNYDSSEIMTKVPNIAGIYAPNIAKSNKSDQVQNSKLYMQLGLVPEEPVKDRKFESLIKFHTTQVMKEYSVYEIRKYL